MAEAYGTRPSELLGIPDSRRAFFLDEALFVRYRLFLNEQRGEGGTGGGVRTFDPPPKDELTRIPWRGDGPDPLERAGAAA